MNKIFSLFAVLLLAVSPFVFAEEGKDDQKAVKGRGLDARYAHASCAVELTKSHLDVLASYAQKDVAALKTNLDVSLASAKDAAAASDRAKFQEAFKAVNEAIKKGKEAVVESRKSGGLKGDNAKAAKEGLKSAQKDYKACQSDAAQKESEEKIAAAGSEIDKFQKRVDELESKGVDVSELQKSLDSARTAKDELSTAAASGDQKSMKDAIRGIRDLSLHMHANVAIAQLRDAISKAEAKAAEKNLTVDFSQAKAEIDKAAALAVSGKKYAEGEFEKVWSSLKSAAEKIRSGVKTAKKQAKDEKKAEKKAERESKKAEKASEREAKKAEEREDSKDAGADSTESKDGGE